MQIVEEEIKDVNVIDEELKYRGEEIAKEDELVIAIAQPPV